MPNVTAAEQVGAQIRAARGEMSLRVLGDLVGISASTIGEYERGVRVPEADKLAKIADALNCFTFNVDEYTFSVIKVDTTREKGVAGDQLPLDFAGDYNYAKANVKITPGRITVVFNAVKAKTVRLRSTASSN